MGLKIAKPVDNEFVTKAYDADVSFILNPTGLDEWRIVIERHKRYIEKRENEITENGFNDAAIVVDKERDKSLFDVQALAVAHHIVKGWQGDIVLSDDGAAVEYTTEYAYQLIVSNPELLTWFINTAIAIEKERAIAIAETLGKSLNGSSGNSNGAATKKSKA